MRAKSLISVAGHVFDLSSIERIGPIEGSIRRPTYKVIFKNGSQIEVFNDSREGSFNREQLKNLWQEAINN